MAVLTMSGDELTVYQLVGVSTFLKARQLVSRGEVLKVLHEDQGPRLDVLLGTLGPAEEPCQAVTTLERRSDGDLINVEGSCSCPDSAPCPHSVALALVHLGTSTTEAQITRTAGSPKVTAPVTAKPVTAKPVTAKPVTAKPATPKPAAWVRSLSRLLDAEPSPDVPLRGLRADTPTFALQFEASRPIARPAGRRQTGTTRARTPVLQLLVRPVRRSNAGNWVRTGISWRTIDQLAYGYGYGLPTMTDRDLTLLEELSALRSQSRYDQDGVLDLAQVSSRRVWDLLAEIRDGGTALVWAGRGGDVQLVTRPVRTVVDVVRDPADSGEEAQGLLVQARMITGDLIVPTERHLLFGEPAHGVLWWPTGVDPTSGARTSELALAPLADPVPAFFTRLKDGGPLHIPAADTETFLSDFFPRLRERLRIISSDRSASLPQADPPRLQLTVRVAPDHHRASLTWSWAYRLGSAVRTEPLRPAGTGIAAAGAARDLPAERACLDAVTARILDRFADLTELFEPRRDGSDAGTLQLAARAEFDGVRTARCFAELLPYLDDDAPDVDLHIDGAAADYRRLEAEPVIAFTGQNDPTRAGEQQDWFDLAVSVTVDGHQVPFEQLFIALAQDQPHLLLPNGGYFRLDHERFRALARLIAESRALLDAPPATVRLTRFQVGAWDDVEELGALTGAASAWRESVLALREAAAGSDPLRPTAVPEGLHATLRPYQQTGLNWLAALHAHRLGGVLADDMGLGKTVQVLALILHSRQHATEHAPFLVVAPTSVVANWAGEAARFAPGLSVRTITETSARRDRTLAEVAAGADLVITSYTLLRLEYPGYEQLPWSGLILDEAQAVKNHLSAGYRCARDLPAPFKIAVTGTPIENNLMELWSLMSITAPGLFATASRFAEHYRNGIERERDPELLSQLRRRLRPLMLRRTKDLVAADLPDKQEQVLELDLNPKHRAVYDKYLQRERQKVLGLLGDLQRNRFEIFKSLSLLRQAALDVALVDPAHAKISSTKLDALMDRLQDIAGEGHRVLVFSQFTRFLRSARDRLDAAGIGYCYLDGSTRNRPRVLQEFRTGTAPVFLISLKAGGTGLTLTEADYVVLLDPWWNPATEAQAVDRVHRIGQTRKVMVYRLVARNTIEDKVMALKAGKAALISSVLDTGELSSGALDADEIRSLLD